MCVVVTVTCGTRIIQQGSDHSMSRSSSKEGMSLGHQESLFEDEALRSAVLSNLGLSSEQSLDAEVVANKVISISAPEVGILSLRGIEACKSLKELFLAGNLIDDLEPLRQMQSLTDLDVSYNQLSDLDGLQSLTRLETLGLDGNCEVTDISALAGLTKMRLLSATDMQIKVISPLAKLTSMEGMRLARNTIRSLEPLKLMSTLSDLQLEGNHVSDLTPLADLKSLQCLDLRENRISRVAPLARLTSLVHLYLTRNRIVDVGPLRELRNLRFLSIEENALEDIGFVEGLTQLEWLMLAGNNITDIGPIVENEGISAGAFLSLLGNPLDRSERSTAQKQISVLRERGVNVLYF